MAHRDLKLVASQYRQEVIEEYWTPLDRAAAVLESPIELAFYWATLLGTGTSPFGCGECDLALGLPFYGLPGAYGTAHLVQLWSATPSSPASASAELWLQVPIEANGRKYRLDFALVMRRNDGLRVFVDVELDGHDFHERTKEQAERDKTRDRDLQSIGWQVARFPGSQVYRDPSAVAHEVFGFALALRNIAAQKRGE
jgi:very-short-patch-repair endonuclease